MDFNARPVSDICVIFPSIKSIIKIYKNVPASYFLDLSALSFLGWKPRHSLYEGLLKTICLEENFLQRNGELCAI